jgi:hypothetical protein
MNQLALGEGEKIDTEAARQFQASASSCPRQPAEPAGFHILEM